MMKKAAIKGLLLVAAFFFSNSAICEMVWKGPTKEIIRVPSKAITDAMAGLSCKSYTSGSSSYTITCSAKAVMVNGLSATEVWSKTKYCYPYNGQTKCNPEYDSFIVRDMDVESESITCKDPAFPDPRDYNGDGKTDRCYGRYECEFDAPTFGGGPRPVGSSNAYGASCVEDPETGKQCFFKQKTDASGQNFYSPMGESCQCNSLDCVAKPPSTNPDQQPPQPPETCKKMGGTEVCTARPEDHCRTVSLGSRTGQLCDSGCGYAGSSGSQQFVCVKEITDNEPCKGTDFGENRPGCAGVPRGNCPKDKPNCGQTAPPPQACQAGDTRPACAGVNPGNCPVGQSNCEKNPQLPTPPQRCQAGDTRPECSGLNQGECPKGAICEGLSGIEKLLQEIDKKLQGDAPNLDGDTARLNNDYGRFSQELTGNNQKQGEFGGDVNGKNNSIKGAFTAKIQQFVPVASACSDLTFTIPEYGPVKVSNCSSAPYIRAMLAWVFVIASFLFIRSTFVEFNRSI